MITLQSLVWYEYDPDPDLILININILVLLYTTKPDIGLFLMGYFVEKDRLFFFIAADENETKAGK